MESREDSLEEKTEEPTEERRNQSREEGNIANPREMVSCVTLILITMFFYLNSQNLLLDIRALFGRVWLGFKHDDVTLQNLTQIVLFTVKPVLIHIVFLFSLITVFPFLIGLVLTRFNWSWKKIQFDFKKMNPLPGVTKIFGPHSLVEAIKVTVKCCIFLTVIYFILKSGIHNSGSYYFLDNTHYLVQLGIVVFDLLVAMCIAAFVIGGGDYAFNLWKNEKSLRMGKQEIKDEYKKHEGDPLVKSQRKRMARDLVLRKSIQAVPKATFIVTNPEHFAVAIRYVRGMSAPILVAKGQDFLALKIREIAKNNDIMIVENKPLARTIYKTMKIGQEVPSSLYQSIIEVMKYIHKMKGKSYFENRE